MCTYNGEKYLREQLDSILSQTYPIKEIIIQDDVSTDSTVAICEEYAAKHDNIRLYINKENAGVNVNFRTACQRATADFIAISDQDDVWFPTKIEKLVSAIGDHAAAFSPHLRGEDLQHSYVVSPAYKLPALIFGGFQGHTMMVRRELAQRDDTWTPRVVYDWCLCTKAWSMGGIVKVDEPLGWHRQHSDEFCVKLHKKYMVHGSHLTWQPYIYGFQKFRQLQQFDNWKEFYGKIFQDTSGGKDPLAHQLAGLMLRRGLFPTLRLCLLTMKHRKELYNRTKNGSKGIMGIVRGFALPFIFAYYDPHFYYTR